MAVIVLDAFHRSPIDHGKSFLEYFKKELLNNPLNLDGIRQTGLNILLSREDSEQIIDHYIKPTASVPSLAFLAYIETLKANNPSKKRLC